METENKSYWKTVAIIFMLLFFLETGYFAYVKYSYNQEIEKTNICYYDICAENPGAELINNVCFCYNYDVMGEYVLAKTEVMK